MPNPIRRIKVVVQKHKTRIAYGAGVATGVAGMIVVRRTLVPFPHIIAPISSEDLKHLIDNPDDALTYIDPRRRGTVSLFNAVHLKDQ